MSTLDGLFSSTSLSSGRSTFLFFTASGIYTAEYAQTVIIRAIGPGGSGGVACNASGNASGAGAGGFCQKRVTLAASDALTITIGAPGAARVPNTSVRTGGNDGGTTTVTGPGISMTANGGTKGTAAQFNAAPNGGAGGTASGGDINLTGGRGGNLSAVNQACNRATGGGAVDVGLGAFHGGDLTNATVTSTAVVQASGGAGVGEHGVSSSSTGNVSTGGGSVGALANVTTAFSLADRPFFGLYSTIGPASTSAVDANTTAAGALSGSGATYRATNGNNASGAGGAFSGSGAASNNSGAGTPYACQTGTPGYGGGSGAASSAADVSVNIGSGAGGPSIVILEIVA